MRKVLLMLVGLVLGIVATFFIKDEYVKMIVKRKVKEINKNLKELEEIVSEDSK